MAAKQGTTVPTILEPVPAPDSAKEKKEASYSWEFLSWGDCSVRCGGGDATASPSCVEEKKGKVGDDFCKNFQRPEMKTRTCNNEPCKPRWKPRKWGNCTGCTFRSGVRVRKVQCVKEAQREGEDDTIADPKDCVNLLPKPGTRELCSIKKKCPQLKWDTKSDTPRNPRSPFDGLWRHLVYGPVNAEDYVESEIQPMEEDISSYYLQPTSRNKVRQPATTPLQMEIDLGALEEVTTMKIPDECTPDTSTVVTTSAPVPITEIAETAETATTIQEITSQSSSIALNQTTIDETLPECDVETTTPTSQNIENATQPEETPIDKSRILQFFNESGNVKDKVPANEIVLIEVPIKTKTHGGLSDESYEKIGDKLGDEIDMGKKTVYTGQQAAEKLRGNMTSTTPAIP